MANSWFRMYSEFADDPKVQMMPEAMQRRLLMLFCSRCKEETLHETEMAFHWRISDQDLEATKALFIAKGFIDKDWNLINWNRRQFLSDNSTDRVRKHRQAMKQDETLHAEDETLHETDVTVDVTVPEQIQNRTDTDSEQKELSSVGPDLEGIYAAYPRKIGRSGAMKSITRAFQRLTSPNGEGGRVLEAAGANAFLRMSAAVFARSPAGSAGEYTPHPATWFNNSRYLDDPKEWQRGGTHAKHANPSRFERSQASTQRVIDDILRSQSELDHGANSGGRTLEAGP